MAMLMPLVPVLLRNAPSPPPKDATAVLSLTVLASMMSVVAPLPPMAIPPPALWAVLLATVLVWIVRRAPYWFIVKPPPLLVAELFSTTVFTNVSWLVTGFGDPTMPKFAMPPPNAPTAPASQRLRP